MNWNPSDRDCVSATKDAVACEFGEGLALLNLKSNIYYSLNGVGAFIWDLIQ
ncbi:PqqD family protein, partial [Mesorhizobium sp. M00.F.Ca.ET.158.01.1.1]